jgi:HD superfamily phosphohydrolase YqeK
MEEIFADLEKWVKDYIKSYYNSDEKIQQMMLIKEEHTARVIENCRALAAVLELSPHSCTLAALTGLLHDIGRFEQFTRYQTFNDRLSENHAEIGLKVIRREKLLSKLRESDRSIVEFAILRHNAREIGAASSEKELLFAKIIRDADKLDIFRVLEPRTQKSDGTGFSEEIAEAFLNGRQCDYTMMKTEDDRKLVRLIWLYDVYFGDTLAKIAARGYIERLEKMLPPDRKIIAGLEKLRAYVAAKKQEKAIF